MRASNHRAFSRGYTLVEMLVVIAIIGILAALLLPALMGGKQRAQRIWCESNLRQMGIAFHSFAHDHGGKFPMQTPANEGGSLDYAENGARVDGNFYFGYRHFQVLEATLGSTKILICPSDTRLPASNFTTLQNANISYFIGVDAEFSQPMSLLAGDGNLVAPRTAQRFATGGQLAWNSAQHRFKGNVLFADGHVEEQGRGGSGARLLNATSVVLPTINPAPSALPPAAAPSASMGGTHSAGSTPNSPTAGAAPASASPPNRSNFADAPASAPGNSAAPSAPPGSPAAPRPAPPLPGKPPTEITPQPPNQTAPSPLRALDASEPKPTKFSPTNRPVTLQVAPTNPPSATNASLATPLRQGAGGLAQADWFWLILLLLLLLFFLSQVLRKPEKTRRR